MDMPKRDLNVRFAFAKSENPQAAISSPIGAMERTSLRLSSAYLVRRIASWGENLRDRPHERPIFQGFAFLAAVGAHGSIASSLAISFSSRVV